ncbi:MAG TPA: hypothetical protein VNA16_05650 [Abditibacteriaceae bacterium]|nr:hypothetical protein [Abditibacteriaceae bacterium]
MSIAPIIKVREVASFVQMVETRMPFRYGAAKLVRCPHLYVVATIEDAQGRIARGIAADNLPPKWFDKDPQKSYAQELTDQIQVAQWAAQAAQDEKATTSLQLWIAIFKVTRQLAQAAGLPPLLAGFGPSLMERAINDAVGHQLNLPFHQLLRSGALGFNPQRLLPPAPLDSVSVRHTIGLSDPIRTTNIAPDDRVCDGLPQSLEEVIKYYGVRYFKIKVQNDLEQDLDRLTAIAALLEEQLPHTAYHCTLDGNEQYSAFEELLPLLQELRSCPNLERLANSVLFIEQPLARSQALDPQSCVDIKNITRLFPVIIDESDDSTDAFWRALQLGYSGTSHKNCKGTFKSVLNVKNLKQAMEETNRPLIISAEDLTNIGCVALHQDLVALSALGITHAERNGHHYFRGLSHLSTEDQQRAMQAHPDLYCAGDNYVRLDIRDGNIKCRSLHETPGLGVGAWPSLDNCMPAAAFDPSALE